MISDWRLGDGGGFEIWDFRLVIGEWGMGDGRGWLGKSPWRGGGLRRVTRCTTGNGCMHGKPPGALASSRHPSPSQSPKSPITNPQSPIPALAPPRDVSHDHDRLHAWPPVALGSGHAQADWLAEVSPVGQLAFSSQASSVVTCAVPPIAQHSISSGEDDDG